MILGCSIGQSIDIRSFGCLLFEFLTGTPLFQLPPLSDSNEYIDDDHLIQLTDIIHPLPETLLSRWLRASKHYDPNGERLDAWPWNPEVYRGSKETSDGYLSRGEKDKISSDDGCDESADDDIDGHSVGEYDPPKPYDSLEVLFKINKPPEIGEGEEEVIVSLLRLIFQYDPQKRPSATKLLEHRWFIS